MNIFCIFCSRMKKSAIETVEKRKTELLKQKAAMKERKMIAKPKLSSSKVTSVIIASILIEKKILYEFCNFLQAKKKAADTSTRTILVSKQMNTLFGISSSTCTSVILENDNILDENVIDKLVFISATRQFFRGGAGAPGRYPTYY